MTFNGFISYSHAADNRLAPAIQRGLHRLAKPWHRRRALWIFRDQTGLAVTPALWTSIQNALDGSDFFVLLASPEAARSPWVNREIEHWMATKSPSKILPVVTDGSWGWDPVRRDFLHDSTAVPPALRGAFDEEPLYLDLRWARDDQHLTLRHSRFRDAVAQLAAPMHGVSKDELEGEDVRQHKRAQRLRSGALATLVLLTFVAVLTGLMAMRNAERANAAAHEARVQQQSAAEQRSSAERSADEARHQQDLAKQQQAKARDAAAETLRQQKLAQRQKVLAAKAADEADNQQRLAEAQKRLAAQAKADARRQQGNAKLQTQLANAAAARAKAQEQLADQQRALAAQWAAEAKQEQLAAAQAAQAAQTAQAEVDKQTRTLVGRRLTDQAKAMIGQDPQTALMLGTAADKIQNNDDSKRQLAGLVTSTRFAGTFPVSSAEYGPGTDVAVAATTDGLSLWNMAGSRPVKLATLDGAAGQWVWAPTGRVLAVFPKDGPVTLWNVADPAHPARLGTVPGLPSVQAVRFSPDGRTLAAYVASLSQVALWDVSDPARPRPLPTAVQPVDSATMAFSPDGHTLVTSGDLNLDVWDVTDPAGPVQVSSIETDVFNPIAFSPTRPILYVNGGLLGRVSVYDLSKPAQPKAIGSLTTPEGLLSMAFSADGQILVTGDYSSEAVRWNISNPSKPVVIDKMTTDDVVNGLSYSRDGQRMIITTPLSTTIWSTADAGAPRAVGQLAGIRSAVVNAYGPGGRSWVAVGPDGTTSFWDLTHPAAPVRRATVKAFDASVYSAAISPDLRTVVAAGDYERDVIRVTDVTDPQQPVTVTDIPVDGLSRWEMFNELRFSADGRRLVATTSSSRMFLYDLTDRSRPRLVAGPIETDDNSFAFSPDGRTLAGDNPYGGASLWDISNPSSPVKRLDLGRDRAHVVNGVSVAFSPDGRTLLTEGNNSATAALWNVSDRLHPVLMSTIEAGVAAFSPDGRMLLTDNGTGAALWDISDPAHPFRVGSADGWPMALGPDGHSLITGGATLWDFSNLNGIRADPARQACTVTGRGLTNDEWTMYIPEIPYQATCR